MIKVFISYSCKDLAFVERLAKDLKAVGLDVWYDLSGLDGGTRWGREIQNAIVICECFVVVLSPNSVESEWVEKEFMYANSLKKRSFRCSASPVKPRCGSSTCISSMCRGEIYDRNFWVILKAMGVKTGGGTAKVAPVTPAPTPPPVSREIKFRPAWIIALIGLAALIA